MELNVSDDQVYFNLEPLAIKLLPFNVCLNICSFASHCETRYRPLWDVMIAAPPHGAQCGAVFTIQFIEESDPETPKMAEPYFDCESDGRF